MKGWKISAASCALILFALVAATAAQTAKPAPVAKPANAPSVVVLKGAPIGGVRLDHKLHSERVTTDCTVCHHPSKKEKPYAKGAAYAACSTCHTKTVAAPMKTKTQAAFHDAKAQSGTCLDCHKKENAKGKKAPTKCQGCHSKKNV